MPSIRAERPIDVAAIHAVNAAAFPTADEADLVDALRAAADPYLSLVAEVDGKVVGHILFTPVTHADHPKLKLMGLAPMAVHPDHQRTGIGSALVRAGLEACRDLGMLGVVVLGHPDYYPRFGFRPAGTTFGISSAYDVPDEVFLALELVEGALTGCSGCVAYHPAFS